MNFVWRVGVQEYGLWVSIAPVSAHVESTNYMKLTMVINPSAGYNPGKERKRNTGEHLTRKAVFPAISMAASPALANRLTQPVRQITGASTSGKLQK